MKKESFLLSQSNAQITLKLDLVFLMSKQHTSAQTESTFNTMTLLIKNLLYSPTIQTFVLSNLLQMTGNQANVRFSWNAAITTLQKIQKLHNARVWNKTLLDQTTLAFLNQSISSALALQAVLMQHAQSQSLAY